MFRNFVPTLCRARKIDCFEQELFENFPLWIIGIVFSLIPCVVWGLTGRGSDQNLDSLLFSSGLLLVASLLALHSGFFKFRPERFSYARAGHYLAFLKVCRNMFVMLTLCWLFFGAAVWDMQYAYILFFLPIRKDWFQVAVTGNVETHTAGVRNAHNIIAWTLAESFIAYVFVAKLEKMERLFFQQAARASRNHEEIGRTLWLSGIPVRDRATLQIYQMPVDDFGDRGVQGDLKKAIQQHLAKDNEPETSCITKLSRVWLCNLLCQKCLPLPKQELGTQRTQQRRTSSQDKPGAYDTRLSSVIVQPVMSPYLEIINKYNQVLDAHEKQAFYEKRIKTHGKWACLRKFNATDRLKEEFKKKYVQELRMSGHAFVTFDDKKDRDKIVEEREWWEWFDHTKFKFGRAPFQSVTLECRQAPHPSDLRWENLHRRTNWCLLLLHFLLLTLVIVGLVFCLSLASQLQSQGVCARWDSTRNKDVPSMWVGTRLCYLSERMLSSSAGSWLEQSPTVLLLILNASLLPAWIEHVAKKTMGFYLHSRSELFELQANFCAFMLSKFLVPLLSMALVVFWLDLENGSHFELGMIGNIMGPCHDVFGKVGYFFLQYTLNCAFFSGVWSLLQVSRNLGCLFFKLRSCCGFRMVTRRQQRSVSDPVTFSYGYWYAWSLSVAANGMFLSTIVPSMIPVTALFFSVRTSVDVYLFQQGSFDPGPDSNGMYVPRVVHYLTTIIAVKMLGTGLSLLLVQHIRDFPPCNPNAPNATSTNNSDVMNDTRISIGASVLVILSIPLWFCSFQSYLRKMLDAAAPHQNQRQSGTCLENCSHGLVDSVNSLLGPHDGSTYARKDRNTRRLWEHLESDADARGASESHAPLLDQQLHWDARQHLKRKLKKDDEELEKDEDYKALKDELDSHLEILFAGPDQAGSDPLCFQRVLSGSNPLSFQRVFSSGSPFRPIYPVEETDDTLEFQKTLLVAESEKKMEELNALTESTRCESATASQDSSIAVRQESERQGHRVNEENGAGLQSEPILATSFVLPDTDAVSAPDTDPHELCFTARRALFDVESVPEGPNANDDDGEPEVARGDGNLMTSDLDSPV